MSERLLIAYIDGRRIAIPAPQVHSVIELDSVMPVPLAPAFITGITALRSRALTVVDCRLAIGLEPAGAPCSQAIVTERDGYLYALRIDSADDVAEQLGKPSRGPGQLGEGWNRVTHGMVETAIGPALLVDIDRLIAGPAAQAA